MPSMKRVLASIRTVRDANRIMLGITNGRVALRGCQCSEVYAIIAFMDAASPQPTTDPAESLVRIVQGLCEAIAAGCEEQLPASPMKRLVLTQLRRLTAWFAALIADFHAGLLPAGPQANRPGPEIPASPRTLARPPHLLRRGFGWLLRLVPGTAAFDKQVQHWLFGPEMGGTARAVAANSQSQPALPEAGDPAAPALRSFPPQAPDFTRGPLPIPARRGACFQPGRQSSFRPPRHSSFRLHDRGVGTSSIPDQLRGRSMGPTAASAARRRGPLAVYRGGALAREPVFPGPERESERAPITLRISN